MKLIYGQIFLLLRPALMMSMRSATASKAPEHESATPEI